MDDQQFEQDILLILHNDRNGLKHIYEAYCPMIFSVVSDIVGKREDGEDITSEFFIRLWDIADTYKPGKGHRAWMITIARNMAIICANKAAYRPLQKFRIICRKAPLLKTASAISLALSRH